MQLVNIGCHGLNGHQIHGNIAALGRARLAAFSGISEETFADLRAKHASTFDGTRLYTTFEAMLADAEVDLVSLCSARRDAQAQHAVQALAAGKHVLAEKPMATTIDDLGRLRRAAQEAGRHCWTMTSMMYDAALKGLRKVVASGVLGTRVQYAMMKSYPYHDGRPQVRGVDGGIMQAGIHAFSIIGHVSGLRFEDVYAQDTARGNPRPGELQMAANATCRMSDGSLASIVVNYCNPRTIGFWGNDQIRIHGTGGMVELVDGFTRRRLAIDGQAPSSFDDDAGAPDYPQDMVDAILDGTPTLLGEEDGFHYTEAALRAQESMESGQPVRITGSI
jgi:predicted dehydrogenase